MRELACGRPARLLRALFGPFFVCVRVRMQFGSFAGVVSPGPAETPPCSGALRAPAPDQRARRCLPAPYSADRAPFCAKERGDMTTEPNLFSAFAFGSGGGGGSPGRAAAAAAVPRRRGGRRAGEAAEEPAGADPAPAATPATPAKRQRKAVAPAGPPKGVPEKLGIAPLRLILIGHNPSAHAWQSGHYYSNPSNRLWPLLISTGIAPPGARGPEDDDSMAAAVGVGFTDVGSGQPGTDSSQFTPADFQRWRAGFYDRLRAHVAEASASIGCTCGACGAPALVGFTGKRHFQELRNIDAAGRLLRGKAKPPPVAHGPQPLSSLPPGWPLPSTSEVWVLTSTSGAAPMSNAERAAPYQQLAERLRQVPWPRSDVPRCRTAGRGGGQGGAQGGGGSTSGGSGDSPSDGGDC